MTTSTPSAILVATLACATLTACATARGEKWDRTAEEAAIYAVVIDNLPVESGPRPPGSAAPTRVVVHSRTLTDLTRDNTVPGFWTGLYALPGIDRGTVTDFELVNGSPRTIASIPGSKLPVILMSDSTFNAITERGVKANPGQHGAMWNAFYAAYPGALGRIIFSRPGISPNHRQALVIAHFHRGLIDAAGFTLILEKRDNVWTVKRIMNNWVS